MRSFADISGELARRIGAGERVALLMLDALGRRQLEREHDHPLLARLDITPLRSQFPSTTTAHVTTLAFGVPVEVHGLYEWRVLEPSLDEIIVPLRFRPAGSEVDDALVGRLDPALLAPGPTVYEQLAVPALVLAPRGVAGAFDRVATAGAAKRSFATLQHGVAELARAFHDDPELRYAYLYWNEIDRIGHHHGPSSPEFRTAARAALADVLAVADELARDGVTVLITADHGQVDVRPDRVDYLDVRWPELRGLLTHRAAGSARDVFLHVVPGRVDDVIEGLAARLGDRAEVVSARSLFAAVGPRLEARLGDVAVLPAPGRGAWLAATPSVETWNLGSHGGRTEAETATYLARVIPR